MRLDRLSLKGITRFDNKVELDLAALGTGLVALIGANGEGKTTLMEAIPAALFGAFPSRPGHIATHAHGRDAVIEADFTNGGGAYRVRVLIDAERRRLEPYLFTASGSEWAVLTTGRAVEFAREIQARFGSKDLFLASVFAAQDKAGNFLGLKKTARKELFAELLGLGYLTELQVRAKAHLDAQSRELVGTRQEAHALEEALQQRPRLMEELEANQLLETTSAQVLEELEADVENKLAGLERAKAAHAKIADFDKAAIEAVEAAQLAQNRVEIAHGQVNRIEERKAQIPARQKAEADKAEAQAYRLRQHRHKLQTQATLEVALEGKVVGLERVLEEIKTRSAEKTRLIEVKRAFDVFQVGLDRARKGAELLETAPCAKSPMWARVIKGEGQRVEDLAGTCPLLESARADKAALETADGVQARDPIVELDGVSARLDDLHQWAEELREAQKAKDGLVQIEENLQRISLDHGARRAELDQLEKELGEELEEALQTGGRAVDELEDLEHKRDKAMARRETQAAAFGAVSLPGLEDELFVLKAKVITARNRMEEIKRESARLELLIEQLDEKAQALGQAKDRVIGAQREVKAWALIEEALGKDGIQALEIDAAGPEVAGLTNELLRACYGPRFSISFETLREKRSGGHSEAFDVKVYDGGAERAAEAISGGEKVIISEAIGLAIAIFNARKSGVHWRTLWRDETAGALWPETAQAYVAMLRKARELGGFDQVIFVSHQPEVWEAADVQARVAGGEVRIS